MSLALPLLLVVTAPTSTVVVALEDDPELEARLAKVRDWSVILGAPVLDAIELQRRFTGIEQPRTPDAKALQLLLDEAAEREARFDTAGANALRREVLKVYDAAVLPSTQLEVLAARALHDIAAAHLGENRLAEASSHAKEALRRFPGVPLDTAKHPPAVEQLMKRSAVELRREASGELTVSSTEPGELVIDGMSVAPIHGRLTRKIALGPHRLWIKTEHGSSLARSVNVGGAPVRVEIDAAVESRLVWAETTLLRCAGDCDAQLVALARAARVERAVGLALDRARQDRPVIGAFASAEPGTVERATLTALAAPAAPTAGGVSASAAPIGPRFRPWSLAPFGVGQMARDRWIAGVTYAAIQAGLAVWHASAIVAHEDARLDRQREPELRERRNLSGGLLVAAVVAGVAEALIVDAVDDD